MRTPTQYETAMAAVAELRADDDIRPNESVVEYVARLRHRSPDDMWNAATVRKLRTMAENLHSDKDNDAMADYWLRRIIEIIQDLRRETPVSMDFLVSVPASAGERMGQQQ